MVNDMNKLYEYVKAQEKSSETNFEATKLQMFNDQATVYWAVRQFMEVNDLTERLYTKEEMWEASKRGENGMFEYFKELNK